MKTSIKNIEDEDDLAARVKPKLPRYSPYILEEKRTYWEETPNKRKPLGEYERIMQLFTLLEETYEPPLVDEEEEKLLAKLRAGWEEKAADIMKGAPNKLPPFREINHKIPLIDENKWYNYHLPRCPDVLKPQLIDKIKVYTEAGWWQETNVPQAAPM